MNSLTRDQRQTVEQMVGVCGCTNSQAIPYLEQAGWALEAAINNFFNAPPPEPARSDCDLGALTALFEKYKDESCDSILVNGVEQFCIDLNVDPTDVLMLIVSFHLNAGTMCEYTRDEFVGGFERLGCDSIESIKNKFGWMRDDISSASRFREFYSYVYDFGREPGQKSLSVEMAVPLWKLVLEGRYAHIDKFLEFMGTQSQAVSKDTWDLFLEFTTTVDSDLSNYSEDDCWPVLIDAWVDHFRSNHM